MARPPRPATRPWVNWAAGRINDPILRLRFLRTVAPAVSPSERRRRLFVRALLLLVLLAAIGISLWLFVRAHRPISRPVAATLRIRSAPAPVRRTADVWMVEKDTDAETYSNGLRIDTLYTVATHRRSYLAFPAGRTAAGGGILRSEPAGIVFHTTESPQAPFEAGQNRALTTIGGSLLEYVQRKHSYNFLIDRFGRVHRVVRESDAADHAGYSVWADEKWTYLNLNESFLGVSFEARTQPTQPESDISPAQVRAAAILTEMLRSRFGIAATNCVTHGQVSVNPSNMQIGYHTDWASSFPFEKLGLPDNYAQPLPAMWIFGFGSDMDYLNWTGMRIREGVESAAIILQRKAAESGLSLTAYTKLLHKRYHDRLAELRQANSAAANRSE